LQFFNFRCWWLSSSSPECFLKNLCYDTNFSKKLAVFWVKKRPFFGENIFKIITSVPVVTYFFSVMSDLFLRHAVFSAMRGQLRHPVPADCTLGARPRCARPRPTSSLPGLKISHLDWKFHTWTENFTPGLKISHPRSIFAWNIAFRVIFQEIPRIKVNLRKFLY
jgi:hypothetical protein